MKAILNQNLVLAYDELLQQGYQVLSWSDTRLAVLAPGNYYEIWRLTKNDKWKFYQREHSF